MDEPLRRLEIRLPVNHPIFSVEPRKRNQAIRDWLDISAQLVLLNSKLDSMQYQPMNPIKPEIKPETEPEPKKAPPGKIDVSRLKGRIDAMFE